MSFLETRCNPVPFAQCISYTECIPVLQYIKIYLPFILSISSCISAADVTARV